MIAPGTIRFAFDPRHFERNPELVSHSQVRRPAKSKCRRGLLRNTLAALAIVAVWVLANVAG